MANRYSFILVCLALAAFSPAIAKEKIVRPTLFNQPMQRDGFHFQVAFGFGTGPTSRGVFHNMEIGGTFANGWTLAYNHVLIQTAGLGGQRDGDLDLIGGHLLQVKIPLYYQDIVAKFGIGPGGSHDQSDGLTAIFGPAWAYGIDVHMAVFDTSGITLGVTILHTIPKGQGHHMGFGLSMGYTWY
jgi:hypothetical protein